MIIPLYVLALVFLVPVAGVGIMGALKSKQLFAYGGAFSAFLATAVFWGGFALILLTTWSMLAGVDWTTPLLDLSVFLSPPV
ncbi:hypothetical protein EPO33_04005 [Patescibacteria group bacterium]|nr:MAG: hypothetical protein EPO33_04005 [Patescibacteria group bacterium]